MKILSILVSIATVFAMAVPTLAYTDPAHCDRPGYPSCWDLGRVAGQSAGSGPCSSGHSHNFCACWRGGVNGVTEVRILSWGQTFWKVEKFLL